MGICCRLRFGARHTAPYIAGNKLIMADDQDLIFCMKKGADDWQRLQRFASLKNARTVETIEMYGFGSILRRMVHMPNWFPLHLKSQHGISLFSTPIAHEMSGSERFLLVHSTRWEQIYHSHGFMRATAIGSPFVMFRRNLLRQAKPTMGLQRQAIFYLSHSTFWEKAEWQSDRLFMALDAIKERHGSVTVCVHFVDVLNDSVRPLFDAGYEIVTAGNYFNNDFPNYFYKLMLNHEFLYTNAVGSHVFYAIEAGKEIHWVDLSTDYTNIGYTGDEWQQLLNERPIQIEVERCLKLGYAGKARLLEICNQELGLDTLASRFRLLSLFVRANPYLNLWLAIKLKCSKVAKKFGYS